MTKANAGLGAPSSAMTEAEIHEAERWFETNLRDGIAKHSAKHGLRLIAEVRQLREELGLLWRDFGPRCSWCNRLWDTAVVLEKRGWRWCSERCKAEFDRGQHMLMGNAGGPSVILTHMHRPDCRACLIPGGACSCGWAERTDTPFEARS